MSHERSRLSEVAPLDAVGRDLERAAEQGGQGPRYVGPVAAGAVAALLLAATVFTAPGRAVAEQLGELVGIGDEPTQDRLRTPAGSDYPAVVIGTGETPGGERYEIVASSPPQVTDDGERAACISVEVPGFEGPELASCFGEEPMQLAERVIDPLALTGGAKLSPTRLMVQGLALPEVARVEVRHPSATGALETTEANLGLLDEELASRIDLSFQAGYFIAFLPEAVIPSEARQEHAEWRPAGEPFVRSRAAIDAMRAALAQIEVVAYGAEGEELARRSLDSEANVGLLDPPAAPPPALAP